MLLSVAGMPCSKSSRSTKRPATEASEEDSTSPKTGGLATSSFKKVRDALYPGKSGGSVERASSGFPVSDQPFPYSLMVDVPSITAAATSSSEEVLPQQSLVSHNYRGHHDRHTPENSHRQNLMTLEQSPVSLRGGALSVQIETEDEDTDMVEPEPTTGASRNFIHGYNGKFKCANGADSFKKTALKLLGYDFDVNGPWAFSVDLYHPGKAEPSVITLQSTQKNYAAVFRTRILPFLQSDTWRVFVRSGRDLKTSSGGMLEPCRTSMKDVIRLIGPNDDEGNTVYWKIPKDVTPKYGINQCQPGFFGAMKLLFSAYRSPPQGPVTLRFQDEKKNSTLFNLGRGGMEATAEVWEGVCEAFQSLDPEGPDNVDILVLHSEVESREDHEIGAHMTGSLATAHASFTNPERTYDEIEVVLNRLARLPVAFRIWHNAFEREKGSKGEVIQLQPKQKAVEALKEFFEGWNRKTECCWYRPEWMDFTVESLGSNSPVKAMDWPGAPACQELTTFKSILQPLLGAGEALESFTLTETQSLQGSRRYVITKNTSNQEWRMHIYDWLHSNKIYVKPNTNINYGMSCLSRAFRFKSVSY